MKEILSSKPISSSAIIHFDLLYLFQVMDHHHLQLQHQNHLQYHQYFDISSVKSLSFSSDDF